MFFIKTNNKSLDDRYSWGRGSLQGRPRTFSITVRGSRYSSEISKVRKRLKICGQRFHSSEIFEVFLLTYQRFLEVLFSHSITKTLRFLFKKKVSWTFQYKNKTSHGIVAAAGFRCEGWKESVPSHCVRYASETLWISGLAVTVWSVPVHF